MEDIIPPETETQPNLRLNEEKGDTKKDEETKVEGENGSSSGLMEYFLPNLVTGKEAEKGDQEGDKDDEKRGGLISNFISNLVSPSSTKTAEFTAQNGETRNGDSKSEEENVESGGGGIVNNLISNLFHQNDDVKRSEEESKEKKEVDDERREKKPVGEEESGGAGIIETIISHFPTSLPEDSVPTTDEASILIHSIVKD